MVLTQAAREGLLQLLFEKVSFGGGFLDDDGSLTNFHLSLHEASPGDAGTQETNETTYTSYARQPVVRTSSGWARYFNQYRNAAAVTFPANGGGTTHVITHVGLGTLVSGTGFLIDILELSAPRTVTPSMAPGFLLEELIWTLR